MAKSRKRQQWVPPTAKEEAMQSPTFGPSDLIGLLTGTALINRAISGTKSVAKSVLKTSAIRLKQSTRQDTGKAWYRYRDITHKGKPATKSGGGFDIPVKDHLQKRLYTDTTKTQKEMLTKGYEEHLGGRTLQPKLPKLPSADKTRIVPKKAAEKAKREHEINERRGYGGGLWQRYTDNPRSPKDIIDTDWWKDF
jgi:hypothetical protein